MKRAKTTSGPAASSSSSSEAPAAGPSKADEKKSKMQVKKIFDRYAQFLYRIPSPSDLPWSTRRLKKECKSDSIKFQGSPKTIKIDEVWEQSEFEAIFSGKGTLIQPTPDNKPKSTVTIIHFVRSPLQSLHTSHVDPFFCRRPKPKSKNSSVAS